MKNIITETEKYLKENIPPSWEDDAIYLMHVEDVRKYASILAKEYGEDVEVAEIAALLHDMGYLYCEDGEGHAAKSAEMAGEYLSKFSISEEKKEKIVSAIKNHSMGETGNNKNISPMDQIIRDADGISFMKNNIKYYYAFGIKKSGEKIAKEKVLKKIDRMKKKVKTELGDQIVQEFYKKAKEMIEKK